MIKMNELIPVKAHYRRKPVRTSVVNNYYFISQPKPLPDFSMGVECSNSKEKQYWLQ